MRADDLQTPCLLVHLDRVRHNLETMRRYLGGAMDRWRPHVKTSKIPQVLALLLERGVRRFKCATSREAEVLLQQAGDRPIDLLVAMAHQGANLQRIQELAAGHPRHTFGMLTEDPDHAKLVKDAGMRVFLDLDPGYHRTGVPLSDADRIAALRSAAGEALSGLHYYDGHLHDGTPEQRRSACEAIYGQLLQTAGETGDLEVITSGTPTFPMALAYAPFEGRRHTVSPGTVVYWDARSQELEIEGFDYAVEVLSRVISRPTAGRITLDAGSKALDAAAGDPCAIVRGPWNLRASTPSEEHLPMRVEGGDAPPLGAILHLVPRHVCPTVNLADEAVLMEDGEIVDVVPVTARGHETLVR